MFLKTRLNFTREIDAMFSAMQAIVMSASFKVEKIQFFILDFSKNTLISTRAIEMLFHGIQDSLKYK